MRRLLLASVIAMTTTTTAHAQLAVFDNMAWVQEVKSYLQDLEGYAVQLRQLQQQVQTVQWVATTAAGLIHNPSLGGVMTLLNMTGLSNDLPLNPYALHNLATGYGGIGSISSKLGSLGNLVNDSFGADTIYTCQDETHACQSRREAAASHAGLKGVAMSLYRDLKNHTEALVALRARAAEATDTKDALDVQNQIATEQVYTQNTMAQLQAVQLLGQTQDRVRALRDAEKMDMDINDHLASRD
jgi:conjugal transfer/entry exclusion protein